MISVWVILMFGFNDFYFDSDNVFVLFGNKIIVVSEFIIYVG